MDYAHEATEAILRETEMDLQRLYGQAQREAQAKLDDYLSRFRVKDDIKRRQVQRGNITQEQYNYWRKGQICIGQRWQEMVDTLARDYTNSDQLAMGIVNGYTPEVYALNHNYATFKVEHDSLIDTSYTLYDRPTVERLIRDNPDLLPKARVDIPKDMQWNRTHIKDAITQGVLQGDDLRSVARRLQGVTDMDYRAAIRNARTTMTGAQNAGRVDGFRRAQDMGIDLEQEWLATLDAHTRDSHRQLDGERVKVGEEFSNGCRYPGDPFGPPAEVYNCRCTLVSAVKGINQSDAPRNNRLGDMSYKEWKGKLTTVPNYTNNEIKALQQYTRSTYSGVNNYLRGKESFESEYTKQLVTDIDSAMGKSPIPKETTVFRGASDDDLRGMFGDGLRRSWFEKADNLKSLEGKTGVFQSYLSTSVGGLQGQYLHGVEWTFIADKETHAVDLRNISVQSSENEFLFARNSKIEILKVDVNEDKEGYIYGVIKILARIKRG